MTLEIRREYELHGADRQHPATHQKERFAAALTRFHNEIESLLPHTEATAHLRRKIFDHLIEFQDEANRLIHHHHVNIGSKPVEVSEPGDQGTDE